MREREPRLEKDKRSIRSSSALPAPMHKATGPTRARKKPLRPCFLALCLAHGRVMSPGEGNGRVDVRREQAKGARPLLLKTERGPYREAGQTGARKTFASAS